MAEKRKFEIHDEVAGGCVLEEGVKRENRSLDGGVPTGENVTSGIFDVFRPRDS